MALPQLLMPAGTPPFLRDTHEVETISLYANTQMQTGVAIRRRMWVSAPRYATVMLEVDQTTMFAIDDWFEGPLKAGVEKFSSQIQNQGPGLLWWSCRFMEPYTVEYLGGLWWRINAKLMLFDDGSVEPPVPTTLVGHAQIALNATAALVAEQPLSGSAVIALERNLVITTLSGSSVIALEIAPYLPPAAVGAAAGQATVIGVAPSSAANAVAVGTSAGNAAGESLRSAVGAADGQAIASGVGNSNIGVGSASGTSTASGSGPADFLLLETGGDLLLLEDGTSFLILE